MEKVQDFDVPADELWAALTEPEQLAAWLGDEVTLDVRPGGQGRVVDDGETRRVVVDDVEEGRRLAFTWWPEEPAGHRGTAGGTATIAGAPTSVELVVEPADAGCRLIVRETQPLTGRWAMRLAVMRFGVEASSVGRLSACA